MRNFMFLFTIMLSTFLRAYAPAQEPIATYRGNSQRTGHADNMPGPIKPNVLWVMKSKEHYIASPVVSGNRLFVSGLGGFNVPLFTCLDTTPNTEKRVLWTR